MRTSRGLRAAAAAAAAAAGLAAASCFVTIDDTRLTAKRADAGSDGAADVDGGAPRLSFMLGYGGGAQAASVIASFATALGRPVDVFSDTLTVDAYQYGPVRASNGRAVGKVLAVELLSESFDRDQTLTDLSKAAAGAYDAVYAKMIDGMTSFADPPVSARIGSEMNGNWRPWSTFDGGTHNATPASYVATFKRVAQMIRTRSPTTLIEWSPALPPRSGAWPGTHTTPLDYWVGAYDPVSNPGGADVVSFSFYEASAGTDFDADVRGGQWGLDWLASFATQNGVKLALSDVATGVSGAPGAIQGGCPCSNDAAWMQKALDWIASRPPGELTHVVFAPWAPADDLTAPGNRDVLGVWTRAWRGSRFAGSWWKGAPVPSQE